MSNCWVMIFERRECCMISIYFLFDSFPASEAPPESIKRFFVCLFVFARGVKLPAHNFELLNICYIVFI